MRLKIEQVENKQPILIVNREHNELTDILKKALKPFDTDIYVSPYVQENLEKFDYVFVIDDTVNFYKALRYQYKQIIFLSSRSLNDFKEIKHKIQLQRHKHVKLIHLSSYSLNQDYIDKMLWFSFDKGDELLLTLDTHIRSTTKPSRKQHSSNQVHSFFSFRYFIEGVFFILIIFHFLFIPFLFLSWYRAYQTAASLRRDSIQKTEHSLYASRNFFKIAKNLYTIPRQTLLIFSTSLFTDNLIDLTEEGLQVVESAISLRKNGQKLSQLLLKNDKTDAEKNDVSLRLQKIQEDVSYLSETLPLIKQKIPDYHPRLSQFKKELNTAIELLEQSQKILVHADKVLAKETEKKYLLLFANNMELRPGGGFIGSFGILKVSDYTLKEINVYDVYDADGQLQAHIEPPMPIKKYLNVPHWFLRDSAFSPDFVDNYAQAKFFLDREINERNFDGALLITTTAVQQMLNAFGDIYLPDFQEKVNARNFYIKTQYYAEKDFFPGSTQKKSFLASLTRNILIQLETASFPKLTTAFKISLDEKQVVMFFNDSAVQSTIDSLYWSGRLIQPHCTTSTPNCFVDYIFPFDANVGGNKANFFVQRLMNLHLSVDKKGHIKHTLSIQFKNDSYADVYPGGRYHNYFQLYLPADITVQHVTQNGVVIDNIEESENIGQYHKLGFSAIIPPQKTSIIEIKYSTNTPIKRGKNIYQLIVQKQIGSSNSDFRLEVSLPQNTHLVSQNFSPLVKDGRILYNTNLTADKIFFIELLKE